MSNLLSSIGTGLRKKAGNMARRKAMKTVYEETTGREYNQKSEVKKRLGEKAVQGVAGLAKGAVKTLVKILGFSLPTTFPIFLVLIVCLFVVGLFGSISWLNPDSDEVKDDVYVFGGYEVSEDIDDMTMAERIKITLIDHPESYDEIADLVVFDRLSLIKILGSEVSFEKNYVKTAYAVTGNVLSATEVDSGKKIEEMSVYKSSIPVYVKTDKASIPWQLVYAVLAAYKGAGTNRTVAEKFTVTDTEVSQAVNSLMALIAAKDKFKASYYKYADLKALTPNVKQRFYTNAIDVLGTTHPGMLVETYCPVTVADYVIHYGGKYSYTYKSDGTVGKTTYSVDTTCIQNFVTAFNLTLDDTLKESIRTQASYMPYGGKTVSNALSKNFSLKELAVKEVLFWDEPEVNPATTIGGESFRDGTCVYPVPKNTRASSEFGPRRSVTGSKGVSISSYHKGIDLPVPSGTNLYSFMAGTVKLVHKADDNTRGLYVIVDHGNGIATLYQHMSQIAVSEGMSVEAGTLLGKSGVSGNITGPHLHFEVQVNGTPVNPRGYIEDDAWPKR